MIHPCGRPCGRLLQFAPLPPLILTLVVAACTIERGDVRTPSGEPPEADTTSVQKVMRALTDGFERGDLAALDTLYHDSVLVVEAGRRERGWRRYRDEHLVPELERLSERRLRFEDIRVRLAGSTAWATYRYALAAVEDGEPVSSSGSGTMVFQKLRGRWWVVHSHTSPSR